MLRGRSKPATLCALAVLAATLSLQAQDAAAPASADNPNKLPSVSFMGSGITTNQERITVDYRAAPLYDVLRAIGETAKVNIIVSSGVANSPVNIRLMDVSYEVALKSILEQMRLGASTENGIIKVDTLDNMSSLLQQKQTVKEQKARLEPTRIMVWQVNYAKAGEMLPVLNAMLADEARWGLKIQGDLRTNKIIVEGSEAALARTKAILDTLDKRKQQVLIEARIVEASSDINKSLNISWGARFGMDAGHGLSTGLIFPNSIVGNVGGAGVLGQPAPPPGQGFRPTQPGSFGFSLGSLNGTFNLDGILNAFEMENLAHVIASPRVVVEDQETANIDETTQNSTVFSSGTTVVERNNTTRLSLNVKPQITSDNTLELDIQVQRDTPLSNDPNKLIKTQRTAKTRLLVNNGETAVIGGLYQTAKSRGQGRIPVLGQLPIIGFLFRYSQDVSSRTELMVMITPRIMSLKPGEGAPVSGSSPLGTSPGLSSVPPPAVVPASSGTNAFGSGSPASAPPPANASSLGGGLPPPVNTGGSTLAPLNAGGGQPPPLNAGGGQPPPLNAGGGQPPPLNAGGGQPPPLNAGGGQPPPLNAGGGQPPPLNGGSGANGLPPLNGGTGANGLPLPTPTPP